MQRKVIRICVSNQALSGAGLSRPYELPEVHRRLASRRKRYVPGTQLKSLIASTVVDVLTHGRTRVERGYGRSDGERSRIQEDDWAAKPLRRLSRYMDRNEFTGARLGSAAQNPSRSRRSDGPTKGSLLVSASAVNTNAPARHGSWASQSRGQRRSSLAANIAPGTLREMRRTKNSPPTATHAVSPPHGSSGAFLATMRLDAFQRFKDRQPSCKTAWVADRSMGIPATAGSVTGPNTSGSPRYDQLRSLPFTAPHRRRAAPQLPDSRFGRRSVRLPRPMVRPSKPIAYACPHCARTPYPRSNRRS